MVMQSKEIESKCLDAVDNQIETKTKFEINKQIDIKTDILQNQLEKCEFNVTNITKNIETIDKAISENEINTKSEISIIQNKIKEINDFSVQTYNEIYDKCCILYTSRCV